MNFSLSRNSGTKFPLVGMMAFFSLFLSLSGELWGQDQESTANEGSDLSHFALYYKNWMCGYFSYTPDLGARTGFKTRYKSDIPESFQTAEIQIESTVDPLKGMKQGFCQATAGDPEKGFTQALLEFHLDESKGPFDGSVVMKSGSREKVEPLSGDIKIVGHPELAIPFLEERLKNHPPEVSVGVISMVGEERPSTLKLRYSPQLNFQLPIGRYPGDGFTTEDGRTLFIFGKTGRCNFFKLPNNVMGLRVKNLKQAPRYFRDVNQLDKRTPEWVMYDFYDAISTKNEPLLMASFAFDEAVSTLKTTKEGLLQFLFSNFLARLTGITASRLKKVLQNPRVLPNGTEVVFSFQYREPGMATTTFNLPFRQTPSGYKLAAIIGLSLPTPNATDIMRLDPDSFDFCVKYLELTLLEPKDPRWESLLLELAHRSQFPDIRTTILLNYCEHVLVTKQPEKFARLAQSKTIEFLDRSPLSKMAMMALWLKDQKTIEILLQRIEGLSITGSPEFIAQEKKHRLGWITFFRGMEAFLLAEYEKAGDLFLKCVEMEFDVGYSLAMKFVVGLRKKDTKLSASEKGRLEKNHSAIGKFNYPTIPLLQAMDKQWGVEQLQKFMTSGNHSPITQYYLLEYMVALGIEDPSRDIADKLSQSLPPLSYESMALKTLKNSLGAKSKGKEKEKTKGKK